MSDWLKVALDPYDRRARLVPALCSGAPLLALGVLLFPGLGSTWSLLGGLAALLRLVDGSGTDRSGAEASLWNRVCSRPGAASLRWRCCDTAIGA